MDDVSLLAVLIFAAAVLYTSVGHAGASGYIAAMALMGLSPLVMKPTALTLNILVAGIATWRWTQKASWPALLPLVLGSVPAAFVGGAIQLSNTSYRMLIGVVLLVAGIKFLLQPRSDVSGNEPDPKVPWASGIATGAAVGLLSGLSGTGGGIFLSPLILLFGWAGPRQTSGLTAPFILLNSVAALIGNVASLKRLPIELPWFIAAALLGALVGTQLGTRWVSSVTLQRLLGAVLLIAAAKFLLS
jgi:uncharacterized protein